MRLLHRLTRLAMIAWMLMTLSTLILIGTRTHAQSSDADQVIDMVMADLSQRLHKKITRDTYNWNYSETLFSDASLGCPRPGQSYAPKSIKGYIITITVDGVDYDYRYSEADNSFFLCKPQTPPPPTPRPTSIPLPTPTATIPAPRSLALDKMPLAYIVGSGNVQITALQNTSAVPVTDDRTVAGSLAALTANVKDSPAYGYLRWSGDGAGLLFNVFKTNSIVMVKSGQQPKVIVPGYGLERDWAAPAAWSPDSGQIAFLAGSPTALQLLFVGSTGGFPALIVNVPACAALKQDSPSDPAETAFRQVENKVATRDPSALFWLNDGSFLLEIGLCEKLLRLDKTGVKWSLDHVRASAVSADGSKIAAIVINAGTSSLVTVDPVSGSVTTVPGAQNPDRVAWTADGASLVYSTITALRSAAGDAQDAIGKQIFGTQWPIQAQTNTVALWRIPAAGGTPAKFFTWEGYGIADILPLPDNSGVLISYVTSSEMLLRWISQGIPADSLTLAAPHAEIFDVRFDSPVPQRIAFAGQPATGKSVNFQASTLPGMNFVAVDSQQCPGAPPSRLISGYAAHVTPGDANSMRASPTGSVVGSIPGGSALTVLSGPVCGDKGVVWWQVDFKGIKGWTAEGQGTNYYVEP